MAVARELAWVLEKTAYTVEPVYNGHPWDHAGCSGCYTEVACLQRLVVQLY